MVEGGELRADVIKDQAQPLDPGAAATAELVDDDGAVAVQRQRAGAAAGGLVEGDDDGAGLGLVVAAADVEGAGDLVTDAVGRDKHDPDAEGARAWDRGAVDVDDPGSR